MQLVTHIEERLSILKTELCAHGNGCKHKIMIVEVMSTDLLQTSPLFEALVDSLVPSSGILFGTHVRF